MAHWNGKTIIYTPPVPYPRHPGWSLIDCGCCGGLQWGGETPRECHRCGGNGTLAQHKRTGVIALYPGGPFARA